MRMIVDVSSVCWMSLLAGKDVEHGRRVQHDGREVQVNSAIYGYENSVNHVVAAMKRFDLVPSNLIFVVEGQYSKALRKSILPRYKETRSTRPDEAYDEFNKLKVMLTDAFRAVGSQVVTQDGVEADDVIAYLCEKLEGDKVVLTNDGDMAALVSGSVHLWRRDELDVNPYGPFPHKYIAVYKALVGDSSDNIPGAFKFGEKAFLNMYVKFGDGGLEAMKRLIEGRDLGRLVEDVEDMKELQRVMDSADTVYASYDAAKLYPEWVNTLRNPLQWKAGMVRGRDVVTDERLHPYAQQVRLIHAGNYDQAITWARDQIAASPFVSLDIETSTPQESDDWLDEKRRANSDDEDKVMVDAFGSRLTGLGMTFGANSQYTFYLTVDHSGQDGVRNCSVGQVRDFVGLVPETTRIIVHNAAFELPICYMEWGKEWETNSTYHGFLPNVRDTRIAGSYVNENRRQHLKGLSKDVLDYEQETYDHVTTIDGVQHKMRELTASHVLSYGSDDTICTAALWNHFRTIMEIEGTFQTFEEVETFPAYLTALAFVQGTRISIPTLVEMEGEDNELYDRAWSKMREFLIRKGYEGSVCPVLSDLEPASIKTAHLIVTGSELKTQVRKPEKLAALIRSEADDEGDIRNELAAMIEAGDLDNINALLKLRFKGEPVLDVNSPKKMRAFLYDLIGIPLQIINDVTPNERRENPALADAALRWKKRRSGGLVTINDEDVALLRQKAKTDDTAVEFALAFDRERMSPEAVEILEAFKVMKTVNTRRKMFYRPYRHVQHWKDGLVHSELKQCQAVTRRYACAGPNLQQLPKRGDGVRFRKAFVPHHSNAVICSIDFSGQELRLAAWRSQDKNMLSCYVGDNLRDIHSLTAAFAMKLKWGAETVSSFSKKYGTSDEYDLFLKIRKSDDKVDSKKADDLRKDSKNVNFAAQFGGRAPKLSETLIMPLEDAQLFLDARSNMFPGVEKRAAESAREAQSKGYGVTMLGARRHLDYAMKSDDLWEVERASRQAWNMEIQGSAAEMTKLAMTRLWKSDFLWKYDTRFIAPIHDELVTSIAIPDVLDAVRIKHDCMVQKYGDMEVPVLGSISLGKNFGDQIECGDWYIPENIKKALAKCGEAA